MELAKNIGEILQDKYIVPLYQRNFAWGEEQIIRLLQDIYESYKSEKNNNYYYIGTLTVLERNDGSYEVIDGQQRLTVITLISKILGIEDNPKLFYDSRPEVEEFFRAFYAKSDLDRIAHSHKISHFIDAIDYINGADLSAGKKINPLRIDNLKDKDKFKDYIKKNVILVRDIIPKDTDVATYFEIMNNRGRQLQKHEIVKAKLLEKIDNPNSAEYAKIWDACSQMDTHIQKLFNKEDRIKYFGNNYDAFAKIPTQEHKCPEESVSDYDEEKLVKSNTIASILNSETLKLAGDKSVNDDIEDEGKYSSIIDFPNFLMHVFKLKFNERYKQSNGINDIPLNEKFLIDVFDNLNLKKEDAESFIKELLYYRTVFDRYIPKTALDDESKSKSDREANWTLKKPKIYTNNNTTSLIYENTFDKQKRIIKCLSMLQVTFRSRIYKNWLHDVLTIFDCNKKEKNSTGIEAGDFLNAIEKIVLDYYTNNISKDISESSSEKPYDKGTNTPHFLFNFIDYLFYVKSIESQHKKEDVKIYMDFKFTYRNSVEHHLPQSFKDKEENKGVDFDSLGNLCLVSKSANSRMNNESPKGKADKNGKYYRKDNLPPKQKIMYDITNSQGKWRKEQIEVHHNEVIKLLNDRESILKIIL